MFPAFPALATTMPPMQTGLVEAPEGASVSRPKAPPRLMLITSAASAVSPSPFGSRAISIAMTTFAVDVDAVPSEAQPLKILIAYRDAAGATPPGVVPLSEDAAIPAAVLALCVQIGRAHV